MATKKKEWSDRIKSLRESNGWTQDDLAGLIGLKTRGAISRLESGDKKPTGPVRQIITALENNPNIFRKSC